MVKLPNFVGMLDSGDPDFSKKTKRIARGTPMEEVVTVDLNYAEVCTLLESGTVEQGSALYVKLRTARDAFLRQPKVYGRGYSMKSKENK